MPTAAITGIGTISCCGPRPGSLLEAALEGRPGISVSGGSALGRISDEALRGLPRLLENPEHRLRLEELVARLPESKSILLTAYSVFQAMAQAGWSRLNPNDGLILATTTGQVPVWDVEIIAYLRKQIDAESLSQALRRQPLASLLESVQQLLGEPGRSSLVTSACSASTQAIGLACLWLEQGSVERVLVGGTEVLCDLTVEGFRSLQLLAPEFATPFDRTRRGINLSEGSSFFCLERADRSGRGATLATISGFGMSTDAYHMTAPHPEGDGAGRAMRTAVQRAKLDPSEISWVHAHGTGSVHNDRAEGLAISRLFSSAFVSSTKGLHGHALGASGALELALCVEALRFGQSGLVLGTHGLSQPDPEIPVRHPGANLEHDVRHILKSTLGFGGANAALVLSRAGAIS